MWTMPGNKLVDCPACRGSGKRALLAEEALPDGTVRKESFETKCLHCGGTGRMTESQAILLKEYEAVWCACGNPSGQATYHPDTPEIKHHWTCNDCGKTTQVG